MCFFDDQKYDSLKSGILQNMMLKNGFMEWGNVNHKKETPKLGVFKNKTSVKSLKSEESEF